MQIIDGPNGYNFDIQYMKEIRAVRLDKNEKTVKDIIKSFKDMVYPPTSSKTEYGILLDDDNQTNGYLKLDDDVILPKYLDREVSHARLEHDKWNDWCILKIYLKPLIKRENIFFEFSEGMLADSNIIDLLRDFVFSAHRSNYFVILLAITDDASDIIRGLRYQNVFVDGIVKELPENGNYFIFKCERSL